MLKLCLSYGGVAGLLVGVPLFLMTVAGPGHLPGATGICPKQVRQVSRPIRAPTGHPSAGLPGRST